jgi:predicted flap endonuclease-1-like 5' DNA nuclease
MNPVALNIAVIALLGFIVGWGVELIIDFFFWRRRATRRLAAEGNGDAAREPLPAEGEVEMLRLALAERDEALLQMRRQVATRGQELASAELVARDYEHTIANLKQRLDHQQAELDHLRSTTLADELNARELDIINLRAKLTDSETAVADLSEQLSAQTAELEALRLRLAAMPQPDQFEALRAEIAAKSAELEVLQQRLDASPDPDQLEALRSELEARTAELQDTRAELESRVRETLEVEAYLQERDEEIKRLTALLGETNAELDAFRQRELDRLVIEETEYIHEDDLTDIKGIGDVYEEKLREAGYYTFRHLADADADELKAALSIPSWRTPNLASWIEQARALAEQKEKDEEDRA